MKPTGVGLAHGWVLQTMFNTLEEILKGFDSLRVANRIRFWVGASFYSSKLVFSVPRTGSGGPPF